MLFLNSEYSFGAPVWCCICHFDFFFIHNPYNGYSIITLYAMILERNQTSIQFIRMQCTFTALQKKYDIHRPTHTHTDELRIKCIYKYLFRHIFKRHWSMENKIRLSIYRICHEISQSDCLDSCKSSRHQQKKMAQNGPSLFVVLLLRFKRINLTIILLRMSGCRCFSSYKV